jgi:hypothetical protein
VSQRVTGQLPREHRRKRLDAILAELREAVAETVSPPATDTDQEDQR